MISRAVSWSDRRSNFHEPSLIHRANYANDARPLAVL